MLNTIPRKGEPVWIISDNEPEVRYFVREHSHEVVGLSSCKNLKDEWVRGKDKVFSTEAEALISLVRDDIAAIKKRTAILNHHEERLAYCSYHRKGKPSSSKTTSPTGSRA